MVNAKESIRELLRQLSDGGKPAEAAARALYKRFKPPFLRYLQGRAFFFSPERAEEISQDVLFKIFLSARQIIDACRHDQARYERYFYRILHNRTIDVLRHEGQAPPIEQTQLPEGEDNPEPLSQIADQAHNPDHEPCVRMAFSQFASENPKCAQAIALRVNGADDNGIAQAFGSKVSAARQLIYECRKHLRALIVQHCPDLL